MNVGGPMAKAIAAVPYCTGLKVGLQFKRRFWEQDEQIYGGMTYTDLPIGQISYPSSRIFRRRQGRVARRVHLGHARFNGIHLHDAGATGIQGGGIWRPNPSAISPKNSTMGSPSPGIACLPQWAASACGRTRLATSTTTICAHFDGRIVLAGEHASYSRHGKRVL